TMTAEALKEKQELLQEMKMQLIYEEMKLKRQVEKSEDIALRQKEKAALETMQQELLQQLEAAVKQKEEEQIALQSAVKAAEHSDIAYKTIEQWAQAFCDRDGETIVKLAGQRGRFLDKDILTYGVDNDGKEYYSFGWSSPWPWKDNYSESVTAHNYRIISVTDQTAEILYYAWVSDPHVTVWREQLTYKIENDKCVITSETLQFIDNICTAEEFNQAYPDGIVGTMMDYYSFNGAGEALNKNAKANKASKPYADLFEPDTSVVYLLNLLKNPNKVGTHVTKSDTDVDTCTVTLVFYEFGDSVDVQMIRPYGSDGIWVPYTAHSESSEDVASIAPYIATGENVDTMITEDAKQLEALFPNHHEFVSNMDVPKMIDLNGDGVEEKIAMVNLMYNGGDGGYALKITDTKTGELIPLPDGYTEENGFPIFSSYMTSEEEKPCLQIQLGEEKKCNTLATITQDALIRIYERNNMYKTVKDDILNHSNKMIFADVISGCNIVTYNNEETPVILLKSYISGFAGHVDTLGYVITELRLLKDNTWAYRHYFLLDSCDDLELSWQKGVETGEIEADRNNGISILPFDKKSDINFQLLLPENR
ncbi:MAG: hypothetical protein K2M91_03495, partial [Lachnospiraceae bacterium]|nr:hypothetical protein [Lachnospiraceae bacterium]